MLKQVVSIVGIGVCLLATGLGDEALATDLKGQVLATHRYASEPFPDERATVVLRGDAGRYQAQTGTGGYYYFYDVRPGRYKVDIKSPYGMNSSVITVRDGRAQRLKPITIKPTTLSR